MVNIFNTRDRARPTEATFKCFCSTTRTLFAATQFLLSLSQNGQIDDNKKINYRSTRQRCTCVTLLWFRARHKKRISTEIQIRFCTTSVNLSSQNVLMFVSAEGRTSVTYESTLSITSENVLTSI